MLSSVVAVVDDDVAVGKALVRLLKSAGLEARAFNGAEAFLSAARRDVGCLILDVMMPGMDGLALHSRLATMGPPVPTIFITALDDDQRRKAAEAAGALAYLRKPFDDEALLGAVRRALETSDREPRAQKEEHQ